MTNFNRDSHILDTKFNPYVSSAYLLDEEPKNPSATKDKSPRIVLTGLAINALLIGLDYYGFEYGKLGEHLKEYLQLPNGGLITAGTMALTLLQSYTTSQNKD